jgi:anti-sigma factor RsiW
MADAIRLEEAHEQTEALLPWYATGQLEASDRTLVETHLSSCASCQRQLKAEHRLIEELQTLTPEIESGWARLRAQLEPARIRRPDVGGILTELRNFLSRPAVMALATAQLAFVLVAGAILLSLNRPGPAYQALGASDAPRTANVLVIFRPDATEEDIRNALRASGASLVGGPTAADAYLINVPPNQRASALSKLQSDDDVQLAEPIDGAVQ